MSRRWTRYENPAAPDFWNLEVENDDGEWHPVGTFRDLARAKRIADTTYEGQRARCTPTPSTVWRNF